MVHLALVVATRRCCCFIRAVVKPLWRRSSDREGHLGERPGQPALRRNVDGKLVVAAPEVLDEA